MGPKTGQQSISKRHHVHLRLLAGGGKTNDVGKAPSPPDKRGNFVLLLIVGRKTLFFDRKNYAACCIPLLKSNLGKLQMWESQLHHFYQRFIKIIGRNVISGLQKSQLPNLTRTIRPGCGSFGSVGSPEGHTSCRKLLILCLTRARSPNFES